MTINWISVSDPERPAVLSPVLVCLDGEVSFRTYFPEGTESEKFDDSGSDWYVKPLGKLVTHWAEVNYPKLPSKQVPQSFWDLGDPVIVPHALARLKADILDNPAFGLLSVADFCRHLDRIRHEIRETER